MSIFFLCYVCYYLLYGFKISMMLMYNLLLVSTLIICQLNIFALTRHDFIQCFLAKKLCSLLLLTYYVKCLQKFSITARELVVTDLDRSVKCLCDNIKNLTLLSVINILEETTGIVIFQK